MIRNRLWRTVCGCVTASSIILSTASFALDKNKDNLHELTPPALTTQWVTLRGNATYLAVSPDGDMYALDASGRVWLLTDKNLNKEFSTNWIKLPGQFRAIRATHDGTLWGIDKQHVLYRFNSSLWKPVARQVLDVSSSPDGISWILHVDGKLVELSSGKPFKSNPTSRSDKAQSLVIDEHGLPWLGYADGSIERFDGTRWELVATKTQGFHSLSIGLDGSIFGINKNNNLRQFDVKKRKWTLYGGTKIKNLPIRHVAVNADGLPRLVLANGSLLAEIPKQSEDSVKPSTPAVFTRLLTWHSVGGGKVKQVSVGEDGTTYSLAKNGAIWRWQGASNWSPIAGKLDQIAAGSNGEAWGLTSHGRILHNQGGFWRSIPGSARHLAVGPHNHAWVENDDGVLAVWNNTARYWQPRAKIPHKSISLAIGTLDEPWIIDTKHTVWFLQKNQWTSIPGITARTIDVGPEGTVYVTTTDNEIYWLDREEMRWKPATGKAMQIAVGPGGTAWIITPGYQLLTSERFLIEQAEREAAVNEVTQVQDGPVFTLPVYPLPSITNKPLTYQTLESTVKFSDIGIGVNGAVFGVSLNGSLLCFNNANTRFMRVSPGNSERVAVTPNGFPWVMSKTGIVSYFDKTAWRIVPKFIGQDIASSPDGKIWAVGVDGGSYRYVPQTNRFVRLPVTKSDGQVKARRIAATSNNTYWVTTDKKQLFSCYKGVCKVHMSGVIDVAIAPDNTVFALDNTGSVQRYNPSTHKFEKQNGRGLSIAVGPQGFPWLINAQRKISYAGLFYPDSKTVNTAECARQFGQQRTPAPKPRSNLVANDDIVIRAPGDFVSVQDLLANDRLNGIAPTLINVTFIFTSMDSSLSQQGSSLVISNDAVDGTILRATYKICPRNVFGACALGNVIITVDSG